MVDKNNVVFRTQFSEQEKRDRFQEKILIGGVKKWKSSIRYFVHLTKLTI